MKTKQQRKDDALKEYLKIKNSAREEYDKKCKEIDTEGKCEKCGK